MSKSREDLPGGITHIIFAVLRVRLEVTITRRAGCGAWEETRHEVSKPSEPGRCVHRTVLTSAAIPRISIAASQKGTSEKAECLWWGNLYQTQKRATELAVCRGHQIGKNKILPF